MGDPKFPSKHYNTPSHPWQKTRIEQERTLTHQYGLKSKKEIWKADTKVREMRRQARKLTAKANDQQAQKEKELLLGKLNRLGMLEQGAALEDILRMSPENILDRRLQTQVYLQGLASTVKQSRQLNYPWAYFSRRGSQQSAWNASDKKSRKKYYLFTLIRIEQ